MTWYESLYPVNLTFVSLHSEKGYLSTKNRESLRLPAKDCVCWNLTLKAEQSIEENLDSELAVLK